MKEVCVPLVMGNMSQARVRGLSKLYVWSVALEPLLFFVVLKQDIAGFGGNISRLLQLWVLVICLCESLMQRSNFRVPNPFHPLYRTYTYYFIFACASGIYGFFYGAYQLEVVAKSFDGRLSRPLFEYVVAIYYFFYFAVLPRYVLRDNASIDYFFKIFSRLFVLSFLLGSVDLIVQKGTGEAMISRHWLDDIDVGFRFHGLAGEPRDAFVYLMLGLAIYSLRDIWKNEKKLTLGYVFLIGIGALLTQSASGLLGVVFALILLLFFYVPSSSVREKGFIFVISSVALVAAITVVFLSDRVFRYVEDLSKLYEVLWAGEQVTSVWASAMNNVYPLWKRWMELMELNGIPLLMGSGLGSASFATASFGGELGNPNAGIVRLIYENGLLGTCLFVWSFLAPVRQFFISRWIYRKVLFLMLLLLGAYLGHRSSAPFIFLGIVTVVLEKMRSMVPSREVILKT